MKIYLDTAAATPVNRLVERTMSPYLVTDFGNPASIHRPGVIAKRAVEVARVVVAKAIEAMAEEIIFTSGGTEANNLAIRGVAGNSQAKARIITTQVEHSSVLEPCCTLEGAGFAVTYLPVNRAGFVSPADLAAALRPDTILVSIAYANNEIGVIQPIRELAKVIRYFKKATSYKLQANNYPYFHTDACQAPRFLDLNVRRLGVDLMTLNSGKIYGPKGVGALYCRRDINLQPLLAGGGQERGRRSGTENVAGVIGFATALKLCVKLRERESLRLTKLRDHFIRRLLVLPGVSINGSTVSRLPNNINVSFAGVNSELLVLNLDAFGVYASSGSACSVYEPGESHVIMALGYDVAYAETAVRFSLGRETTKADLDYVLKILPDILSRARVES